MLNVPTCFINCVFNRLQEEVLKSSVCYIYVSLSPPDIKKQFGLQPISTTVESGGGVTFRCRPPPAEPAPTIRWTRNGLDLDATDEALVLPKVELQVIIHNRIVCERGEY